MNNDSGHRLKEWRESTKLSQRAVAVALGISQSFIGNIEAGRSEPSRNLLLKLAETFGLSADWLLHGQGDMLTSAPQNGFRERQIEPPDYTRPAHGDFAERGEEFSLIERADLSVSAGNGLIPVDGGESERLAFSRTWLKRNQISAQLAVLVRVKGDSMAPGIPDGSLVLVHCAENTVEREGVYAFLRGDEAFVKRLVPAGKLPGGRPAAIIIVSDNRAYPTESISTASDRHGMRIIGRVRCVMATL